MSGILEGRRVLVTGAAKGIGRATALTAAREGARVLVCDLDDSGGKEVVEAIAKSGGEARFQRTDVSREEDVVAMVAAAIESFGGLDCAVNNAGITGSGGPLATISLDDWNHVLAVNLTSVFLCLKHELPPMQQQGSGSIVNIASGAGVVAVPFLSPYCSSKHGVLGLSKTAAVENATSGVRVNAICPGSTDTPMLRAAIDRSPEMEKLILGSTPSGRMGRPEEVAEAAVWLCSDRASYVSGEAMLVDGAAVAR